MTYAGARGPTATQMAAALRFPMDGDRLHRSFAKVNGDVNGARAKGGAELHVANALWTQMGIATLPAFQATVKNLYVAGLTPLDFGGRPRRRGSRSMPGSNSRRGTGSRTSSPKACSTRTRGRS